MIEADESRVLASIHGVLQRLNVPDVRMPGKVVVFLDGQEVCTSVEIAVGDWEVHVFDSGSGTAAWIGDQEDAPGAQEYASLAGDERVLSMVTQLMRDGHWDTPWDRSLEVAPLVMDGASCWDVCLAPINMGHLLVPYIKPPARESL